MAGAAAGFQRQVSVYAALTMGVGVLASLLVVALRHTRVGKTLQAYVHLPDRAAATDAAELIARFGEHAAAEAAARAGHSRDVGNVEHFCRWRQIERLILLLAAGRCAHTLH
jgi:hypothetical protein